MEKKLYTLPELPYAYDALEPYISKEIIGVVIVINVFFGKFFAPAEAWAKAGGPSGKLLEEIQKHFGSFETFQEKFNDVGMKRFGSGWVWLVRTKEGKLDVLSTSNQDNPMTDGLLPIMGNDVWEHAYYLQYKNVRADYLQAWWSIINWKEVEKRFE